MVMSAVVQNTFDYGHSSNVMDELRIHLQPIHKKTLADHTDDTAVMALPVWSEGPNQIPVPSHQNKGQRRGVFSLGGGINMFDLS